MMTYLNTFCNLRTKVLTYSQLHSLTQGFGLGPVLRQTHAESGAPESIICSARTKTLATQRFVHETNKQKSRDHSMQRGRGFICHIKKGVVIGWSPLYMARPTVTVRHTRFPRPKNVGNRIKAVQKMGRARTEAYYPESFSGQSYFMLYVSQNYKTKIAFARGMHKKVPGLFSGTPKRRSSMDWLLLFLSKALPQTCPLSAHTS